MHIAQVENGHTKAVFSDFGPGMIEIDGKPYKKKYLPIWARYNPDKMTEHNLVVCDVPERPDVNEAAFKVTLVPPDIGQSPTCSWLSQHKSDEEMQRGINLERDRRLNGGIEYDFGGEWGVRSVQTDEKSRTTINKFMNAAGDALADVQEGDLRWLNPARDFTFVTADNTSIPLDAYDMFALGRSVLAYESQIVNAGNALKKMQPLPETFQDDSHWV